MTLIPDPWWLVVVLAIAVFSDGLMSIRPPKFIRDCLDGVHFPSQWWWTLVVIKLLATAGLIIGIWVPGVGLAANVGVIVYFICAAYAHIRAHFLRQEFWINCLGFLTLSIVVFIFSFVV